MSVAELNARIVDQLGNGNTVAPREALKQQLGALLNTLEDQGEELNNLAGEDRVATLVAAIQEPFEGVLAVTAPLIEYGGPDGQLAVIRALAHLTGRISLEPSQENAYYLVAARLLWCSTAFALACDAVDFLPRLLSLTVRSNFRDIDERLIDDSTARHLNAFKSGADVALDSHRQWLAQPELLTKHYPLLARDQGLEKALAEADLLFALHADASGTSSRGIYSGAAHRDGNPERRLRARLRTPGPREQLVRFFEIPDAELDERLNEAHERMPHNHEFSFGDVRLLPSGL